MTFDEIEPGQSFFFHGANQHRLWRKIDAESCQEIDDKGLPIGEVYTGPVIGPVSLYPAPDIENLKRKVEL